MKALVVTGSRKGINLSSEEIEMLLREHITNDIELVIHGNAPGVDTIINDYAEANNIQVLRLPAQWKTYKDFAGPKRNQQMINIALCMKDCGWEIICLAIPGPGSKGTYDCLEKMKQAGFHGKVFNIGK